MGGPPLRHAAEKLGNSCLEAHAVPAGVRFAPGLGDGVRNVGGGQLHGVVHAPAERQRACAGAGEQVARAVEHGGNIRCAALRHRTRGIHARHADAVRLCPDAGQDGCARPEREQPLQERADVAVVMRLSVFQPGQQDF